MNQKNLDIFKTPISIQRLQHSEEQIMNLKKKCLSWKKRSMGLAKSNNYGWHSEPTFFRQDDQILKAFGKLFIQAAADFTAQIAPDLVIDNLNWEGQGWININSKGSFNAPHDHPGFLWSGVFYVDIPEDLKDNEGQLEFIDPRNGVMSGAGNLVEVQKYFASNIKVKPETGMLILFPSFLKHWVYPQHSQKDRISIAFNFKPSQPIT
jgi:uncharacterized protein (TIGR02466 family)